MFCTIKFDGSIAFQRYNLMQFAEVFCSFFAFFAWNIWIFANLPFVLQIFEVEPKGFQKTYMKMMNKLLMWLWTKRLNFFSTWRTLKESTYLPAQARPSTQHIKGRNDQPWTPSKYAFSCEVWRCQRKSRPHPCIQLYVPSQ